MCKKSKFFALHDIRISDKNFETKLIVLMKEQY